MTCIISKNIVFILSVLFGCVVIYFTSKVLKASKCSNKDKATPTNWVSINQGDELKLELKQKADLAYSYSHEYLVNLIEMTKQLRKKVLLVLGFTFSFMSFALLHPTVSESYPLIQFALPYILVEYAFISILLICFGFLPKPFGIPGNEPKELINNERFNYSSLEFILQEVKSYQSRIDSNLKTHRHLTTWLEYSALGLIILPLCTLLFFHYLS